MKLLPLIILTAGVTAQAENLRVNTYTLSVTNGVTTNAIVIPNGSAVRVSATQPVLFSAAGATSLSASAFLVKSGEQFQIFKGDVIQGPATVYLTTQHLFQNIPPAPALLTLERWTVIKEK